MNKKEFVNGLSRLTDRQIDALFYWLKGYSRRKVSEWLVIDKGTSDGYIRILPDKFSYSGTAEELRDDIPEDYHSYFPNLSDLKDENKIRDYVSEEPEPEPISYTPPEELGEPVVIPRPKPDPGDSGFEPPPRGRDQPPPDGTLPPPREFPWVRIFIFVVLLVVGGYVVNWIISRPQTPVVSIEDIYKTENPRPGSVEETPVEEIPVVEPPEVTPTITPTITLEPTITHTPTITSTPTETPTMTITPTYVPLPIIENFDSDISGEWWTLGDPIITDSYRLVRSKGLLTTYEDVELSMMIGNVSWDNYVIKSLYEYGGSYEKHYILGIRAIDLENMITFECKFPSYQCSWNVIEDGVKTTLVPPHNVVIDTGFTIIVNGNQFTFSEPKFNTSSSLVLPDSLRDKFSSGGVYLNIKNVVVDHLHIQELP